MRSVNGTLIVPPTGDRNSHPPAKHGGAPGRLCRMQIQPLARAAALRVALVTLVALLILVLLPAVLAVEASTV